MDITNKELKTRIEEGTTPLMVDVREPHEWDMQTLDGVVLISLGTVEARLAELIPYKDSEIIMICRSGNRSAQAAQLLRGHGFTHVRNLLGGMLGWQRDIDPDFVVM